MLKMSFHLRFGVCFDHIFAPIAEVPKAIEGFFGGLIITHMAMEIGIRNVLSLSFQVLLSRPIFQRLVLRRILRGN